MSGTTSTVLYPAGTDLYRLAASIYGDASAVTLIFSANDIGVDPILVADTNLVIPPYNETLANGGVIAGP
jgi:hypothetical protein